MFWLQPLHLCQIKYGMTKVSDSSVCLFSPDTFSLAVRIFWPWIREHLITFVVSCVLNEASPNADFSLTLCKDIHSISVCVYR